MSRFDNFVEEYYSDLEEKFSSTHVIVLMRMSVYTPLSEEIQEYLKERFTRWCISPEKRADNFQKPFIATDLRIRIYVPSQEDAVAFKLKYPTV